jgi:hypothetical protein
MDVFGGKNLGQQWESDFLYKNSIRENTDEDCFAK